MHALSEAQIRASFINVSQRERAAIESPGDLASLDWDRLDVLGWRGSKAVLAGYVVGMVDGQPVGVLLRQTESRTRARPQCAWCEDVTLPNDVVFFGARRAGAAGRRGDSVGTLVCDQFQCSRNVRTPPPPAYLGFDIGAAIERRISNLRMNVEGFLRDIRDNT
jgi:hypothetical protein